MAEQDKLLYRYMTCIQKTDSEIAYKQILMQNYKLEREVTKRADCEKSTKKAKVNTGMQSTRTRTRTRTFILIQVLLILLRTGIT
jgi:hypothetical protein